MRLASTLVALCLCCLAGCGSSEDDAKRLPLGWVRWPVESGGNGHAYGIERVATDWISADASARSRNANLVTITSETEEQFIISTFLVGVDQLKVFWMGCTDRMVEDTWQWVTGEPFVYTHWKSGEPNGWDGEGEDYCALNWNAVRGPIGEWNDTLVGGSEGYDGGANDGPYAAVLEADTFPSN